MEKMLVFICDGTVDPRKFEEIAVALEQSAARSGHNYILVMDPVSPDVIAELKKNPGTEILKVSSAEENLTPHKTQMAQLAQYILLRSKMGELFRELETTMKMLKIDIDHKGAKFRPSRTNPKFSSGRISRSQAKNYRRPLNRPRRKW